MRARTYGCFDFEDIQPSQIWIGGGIGITPFIAAMKHLAEVRCDHRGKSLSEIDLFHSTREYDEAAIAKLVASNAAMDNARDATQIFGGYGFMNEYPVGRFYRDAKILEIGEGTSEIQRMLIARELGLPS